METPISWRQTTTKSSGTVEFYIYSSADNNGYTSFWRYNNAVSPEEENWGWCMIYYNNRYDAGQGTIAHEIGYTMGLDENNTNRDTVMCQAGSGQRVTTPQLGDLQGINAKYN